LNFPGSGIILKLLYGFGTDVEVAQLIVIVDGPSEFLLVEAGPPKKKDGAMMP